MPSEPSFEQLLKHNGRYSLEVYEFVMDALAYTVRRNGERRHIRGPELLSGMRDLALDYWGNMALHVLESWGVRSTEDFGDIVFTMVNAGILAKTDQDSKDDFKDAFIFADAFHSSYHPQFDENGHICRQTTYEPSEQHFNWLPLLGDISLN
jgi:uncharacterized repeat protein (TIGR04138 family)